MITSVVHLTLTNRGDPAEKTGIYSITKNQEVRDRCSNSSQSSASSTFRGPLGSLSFHALSVSEHSCTTFSWWGRSRWKMAGNEHNSAAMVSTRTRRMGCRIIFGILTLQKAQSLFDKGRERTLTRWIVIEEVLFPYRVRYLEFEAVFHGEHVVHDTPPTKQVLYRYWRLPFPWRLPMP